jgi:hypothetical protein
MLPFMNKTTMDFAFMNTPYHNFSNCFWTLTQTLVNFFLLLSHLFEIDVGHIREHPWLMMQQYRPNLIVLKISEFVLLTIELHYMLDMPNDELLCYLNTTNNKCTFQYLAS